MKLSLPFGLFRGREEPAQTTIPGKALLWLIGAFIVLLVPQWDRLPAWLIAACVALAGWRWLAQTGRVRLPGRWLRTGIMLILMAVYINRKSTRLNSSHVRISYAVFCLKKKTTEKPRRL